MSRKSRLSEQIQRELSNIIQMEMRDPRLGMVTITAVELSTDLSLAKVYFTVFEEGKIKDSQSVLSASSGFLRKKLGGKLTVRSIPSLNFYYDESIERGRKISSLIDDALAKDHELSDGEEKEG